MFERELRDLSYFPRWTTARAIKQQTISDHSFFVLIYADQIARFFKWDGDYAALLRWAAWHDVPEDITGDVCGPVKRLVVDRNRLTDLEHSESMARWPEDRLCWQRPTDEAILTIVIVANLLDEVFWQCSEAQMGNSSIAQADHSQERLFKAIDDLPFPSDKKGVFSSLVVNAMKNHRYGFSRILRA